MALKFKFILLPATFGMSKQNGGERVSFRKQHCFGHVYMSANMPEYIQNQKIHSKYLLNDTIDGAEV